jgi:hypothetical protein
MAASTQSDTDASVPLPVAELSAIVTGLDTMSARMESIAESLKGSDRGDQQCNELQHIASTITQAQRRLDRMLKR